MVDVFLSLFSSFTETMLKSQTINAKEGSKGARKRIITIVIYSSVKTENGLSPGVTHFDGN